MVGEFEDDDDVDLKRRHIEEIYKRRTGDELMKLLAQQLLLLRPE